MKKIKLTIVFCIQKLTKNVEKYLSSWIELNRNDLEIIIFHDGQDSCSKNLPLLSQSINQSNHELITYINTEKDLNIGLCFNTAMNFAKGKYLYFVDPSDYVAPFDFDKLMPWLGKEYDLISFNLNLDKYKNLDIQIDNDNSEITSQKIFNFMLLMNANKIYSSKFLSKNQINFNIEKDFPNLFLIKVLFNHKSWGVCDWNGSWINVLPGQYENYYDRLYEIEPLFNKAVSFELYDNFKNEFNYWFLYLAKETFLSLIYRDYQITPEIKKNHLMLKNNLRILKLAIHNVNMFMDKYFQNPKDNPYYLLTKDEIESYYTKIMKVIK